MMSSTSSNDMDIEPEPMTLVEGRTIFNVKAQEMGKEVAYYCFNTQQFRQSLSIPDPIWRELEPSIRQECMEARKRAKAKMRPGGGRPPGYNNPTAALHPPSTTSGTPSGTPAASIPAQYPTKVHKVTQEETQDAMVNLCETLGDLTTGILEDGSDTDDEAFAAFGPPSSFIGMVQREDADEVIEVRAHLEYRANGQVYGFSDSGADSTVCGKHCQVVSHTGCFATLVGYDPRTTRSAQIPIVSAFVKVQSKEGVPVLLLIHEAVYLSLIHI